ncbi:MAG: hypothetical protein QOC81_539 [Thermoanaerobaculia bacterium]|nr:hypothetical protein [Thermoanaerobaculia bacterium]
MGTIDEQPLSPRYVLTLGALAAAISLTFYFPTFHYSWGNDEIEYINVSAAVIAGTRSLWSALTLAHDEHVVPLFRLLFLAYLKLVGLDATTWRVLVVLCHAWSAVCTGLLAWRYTQSRRAGVAATLAYVVPCGFAGSALWYPSASAAPVAFAALTTAAALLAWRDHLRTRRIIAGLAVLAALLCWRSYAPMALLPAIIDEIERRNEGARRSIGPFTLFCLAAIIAVVVGESSLITIHIESNIKYGVLRALFLALVSPFHLFFPCVAITAAGPGRSTALLGSALGITTIAILAALLAALWRRGVPRLAIVATLTAVPALAVLLLIGLFRYRMSYAEFYDTDRYFYPLLIPISLLAGAVAASISLSGWTRVSRVILTLALIAGLCGEAALQWRAMLRLLPVHTFDRHARRFASLEKLVHRLEAAGPLEIPNNRVWFDELDTPIDAAVMTNILSDGKRLRLAQGAVDSRRLDPLFDAWANEIGERLPFVRIVDGVMINRHIPTTIDFRAAPFDDWIIEGFYEWEKPSRWMNKRGALIAMLAPSDLDLLIAAPVSDLRRKHPEWTSLPVRVSLRDGEGGFKVLVGVANIAEDGIHRYRFPTKAMRARIGAGNMVMILLECDHAWTPSEIYGTSDVRERTVQVYSAGTSFSTN